MFGQNFKNVKYKLEQNFKNIKYMIEQNYKKIKYKLGTKIPEHKIQA